MARAAWQEEMKYQAARPRLGESECYLAGRKVRWISNIDESRAISSCLALRRLFYLCLPPCRAQEGSMLPSLSLQQAGSVR